MSDDQRSEWMTSMKEKGNDLYRQKKFIEAIKIYMDALVGLKFEEDGKLDKDDMSARRELRVSHQIPITLNIAMCTLEQGFYDKAKQLVNNAIQLEPDYYKGYFKLAVIYLRELNYKDALEEINIALKLCDNLEDRDNIVKRRNEILIKLKKYNEKQKEMYGKMLQKNIYNEKPNEYVEQIQKQNVKSDANMSEAQKKGLTTLAN